MCCEHVVHLILIIINVVLAGLNYHQTAYEFIMDRAEGISFDKNFVSSLFLKSFRDRKIGILLNASGTLVDDLEDFKVTLNVYQLLSNQYRTTNMKLALNGCLLLQKLHIIQMLKNTNGNFTNCPLKKGTYVGYNIMFDSTYLPPLIPEGQYKVDAIVLLNNNTEIANAAIYGHIKYFINGRKNKA